MAHDIFISYSTVDEDARVARALRDHLELRGWSCWIAERDIAPGEEWPQRLISAIMAAKCLVLVLSSHADASYYVKQEVRIAAENGTPIIAFRIGSIAPTSGLTLYTAATQHVDATTPPIGLSLEKLSDALKDRFGQPARKPNLGTRIAAVRSMRMANEAVHTLARREEARRRAESKSVATVQRTERMPRRLAALFARVGAAPGMWLRAVLSGIRRRRDVARHIEQQRLDKAAHELKVAQEQVKALELRQYRLLPELFRLRWPSPARREAWILFPVFVIAVFPWVTHTFQAAMDFVIGPFAERDCIATLTRLSGLRFELIRAAVHAILAALLYLVPLVLCDRLLERPKGLGFVSLVVPGVWAGLVAATMTTLGITERLPWSPLGAAGVTWPMAFGGFSAICAFAFHIRPIWAGFRDDGFLGLLYRYRRLVRRSRRA